MPRIAVVRTVVAVAVLVVLALAAWSVPKVVHHFVSAPSAQAVVTSAPATPVPPDTRALDEAVRAGGPIRVVGMGSSVGAGAELEDGETESPVGHLGVLLRAALPGRQVEIDNRSVNGSTAFDGLTVYAKQVKALKPTVLLLAYGMNDGQTAQYNSGESLPGSISAMQQLVEKARADGTTVLVATTPSPDTEGNDFSLPDGLPVVFPTPGGELIPAVADSVTMVGGEPFSARHADWNTRVRALAAVSGAVLVDAAAFWPEAIRRHGESALFNVQNGAGDPGRFVHPNLLGHQHSYWPAEAEVVDRLVRLNPVE